MRGHVLPLLIRAFGVGNRVPVGIARNRGCEYLHWDLPVHDLKTLLIAALDAYSHRMHWLGGIEITII
jgi:hypothetical protein